MASVTKHKLILSEGKSLTIETTVTGSISSQTHSTTIPLGKYEVKVAGDSVLIADRQHHVFSASYDQFTDEEDVQRFNSAAEAEEWFVSNFFVEAPSEGGGGTDSFDSQSFTATSNQTQFTTTFDLPSDSKRVKVFVNANGVIVGVPFSKSGNTVTISARAAGENIIVEKI